jgi:tRNA(Ile)-lysidine synthase TilS/MesJ
MKKKFSKILFKILKNDFSKKPEDLLCSISGGQDSIFLLIFLYHLRALFPISLFINQTKIARG